MERPVSSQVNQIQFPRGSTPMKKTTKQLFSKALTKKQILSSTYDPNSLNTSNENSRRPWRQGTSVSKSNK